MQGSSRSGDSSNGNGGAEDEESKPLIIRLEKLEKEMEKIHTTLSALT